MSMETARLRAAFTGASGAFLMVPFDMKAPELHARELEVAIQLANAVKAAKVRRIVCLSGTSAHLGDRAGSGRGASLLEAQIDLLDVPERMHLRACFLMENFLQAIPQVRSAGTFRWSFRADVPTPMIAARDVGKEVARALTVETVWQPRIRELLGPRDYTMAEATQILASAVGRPATKYASISYEAAREMMIREGASSSFADAVMKTAQTFNEGVTWATEPRSARNTTSTTLPQWAEDVFAPMYRSAEAR
jgi:uncharacterized protein YbjT (DUF2867 family)